MAKRNNDIVTVWSANKLIKDNIEFLRHATKLVTFPISPQVEVIIQDLIDTFNAVPCAGIAANQIKYDKKIFIGMKHDREKQVEQNSSQNIDEIRPSVENCEIYINPQIDKIDKKSTQMGAEGCLSIPGLSLNIERYDKIKVRYYNMEGRVIKKPLKGFISRLFQHELDHLEGRLMFDQLIGKLELDQASDDLSPKTINKLLKYLPI